MNPKYKLSDTVGFEGEYWIIGGVSIKFGYNFVGWEYLLIEPDWNSNSFGYEYIKTKGKIPEDSLLTEKEILKFKISKAEIELARLNTEQDTVKNNLLKLQQDDL